MKLFYQKSLPQDIIKYILQIERNLLYKKSIHQWIKSSKLFHEITQKQKNCKKLYHIEKIKNTFLNEIKEINGNIYTILKNINVNFIKLNVKTKYLCFMLILCVGISKIIFYIIINNTTYTD